MTKGGSRKRSGKIGWRGILEDGGVQLGKGKKGCSKSIWPDGKNESNAEP
jgi:hypothetical protein